MASDLSQTSIDGPSMVHLETVSSSPLMIEVYTDPSLNADDAWNALIRKMLSKLGDCCRAYLGVAEEEGVFKVLGLTPEALWELDLNLVGNAAIHHLNRQYRGKDRATDVLTFTLLADSPVRVQLAALEEIQLGAVFVSLEWGREQVGEDNFQDSPVLMEYLLERVVHGLLHLMGVNHDTMEEYNKVVAIQKRVLNELS